MSRKQSYVLAQAAFDNLKKTNTEKFDFSKNFNTEQKVVDAESGKSYPVVFMDIDETILANDYTEAEAILSGGFEEAKKVAFDIKGIRREVPGAINFINYVHEHGGIVMFNSNMPQGKEIVEKTIQNLKTLGVKFVND
ncbi:UNVERIFIED_CONTAM: hypothetical protein O8I53_09555 [Campylobacter lari]